MYYSFGPAEGFQFHPTEEAARAATMIEMQRAAETTKEPIPESVKAISWGTVIERVQCIDTPQEEIAGTPEGVFSKGVPLTELNGLLADGATDFLAKENKSLRDAGFDLANAAIAVARNYDGVHRLLLAVSDWFRAVANEGGRGDRHRNSYP